MNLKNLQQSYLCELPNTARRRWHSPDATLLALAVTAVRASLLDRVACGRLAGRFAAAAARRELAARPHCAVLLLRNEVLLSTCNMIAAGRCWCLSVTNSSVTVHLAQAGSRSTHVLVPVGEVGLQAGLHTIHILLHEASWCTWSSELADLFHIWRTASSRSFDWCAVRRRRLRAAGVSGVDS